MELFIILAYLGLFTILALAMYLIGFSIGRRSAYKDFDMNYEILEGTVKNSTWKPKSDHLLEIKITK